MGHYDEPPTSYEIECSKKRREAKEEARVRAALALIGRTNIVERLDSLDGAIKLLLKRIAKLETDLEHARRVTFIGSL